MDRDMQWAEVIDELEDRVDALTAQNAELLEALEKAARYMDAMASALRSEQLLAAGSRAAGWAEEAKQAIAKAKGESA